MLRSIRMPDAAVQSMLAELKQQMTEVEELLATDPDDVEAAQVPHRRCGCDDAYQACGFRHWHVGDGSCT